MLILLLCALLILITISFIIRQSLEITSSILSKKNIVKFGGFIGFTDNLLKKSNEYMEAICVIFGVCGILFIFNLMFVSSWQINIREPISTSYLELTQGATLQNKVITLKDGKEVCLDNVKISMNPSDKHMLKTTLDHIKPNMRWYGYLIDITYFYDFESNYIIPYSQYIKETLTTNNKGE